jgi:tripartite ATP-independent transporter DctM subunit
MIILTMFVVLLFLLSINVPIAIGLAVTTIIAMVMKTGTSFLIDTAIVMFDGSMKFPLIAIPLFILAGSIMNSSGISRRLIAFASALVGFIKGGLSMINIATSMFFAEISGSAVADVAALGSILIPAMKKKGYPGPFAAAVTSSSASLAIIIPPSIPMIVYAVMAQSSVVQLFVAGVVPGIIGGFLMMFAAYIYARRKNLPIEENFNLVNLRKTAKEAALAFLLPIIILGGIFGGVVTATEGAGLAVVAALIIGLIYREFDFKRLYQAATEGAIQTAAVMLLVAASVLLGEFLTCYWLFLTFSCCNNFNSSNCNAACKCSRH